MHTHLRNSLAHPVARRCATAAQRARWPFAAQLLAYACTLGCGGGSAPSPSPDSEQCTPSAGQPRENGMTCSKDGDCASCNCGTNGLGERRCYGTVSFDETCGDTYDCNSGTCLAESKTSSVCVDITWCESNPKLDECFKNLAVDTCQLQQLCKPSQDFSNCVSFQCSLGSQGITVSQCQALRQKLSSATTLQCR
jgi:hypothetical protein